MVALPGGSGGYLRERQLEIRTSAEGPTCVLTVADLQARWSRLDACMHACAAALCPSIVTSIQHLAKRIATRLMQLPS